MTININYVIYYSSGLDEQQAMTEPSRLEPSHWPELRSVVGFSAGLRGGLVRSSGCQRGGGDLGHWR